MSTPAAAHSRLDVSLRLYEEEEDKFSFPSVVVLEVDPGLQTTF